MNIKTEHHQINTNLTLNDSSQTTLTIRAVTFTLTKQDKGQCPPYNGFR
jgi:hypothetical protein